MESAWSVDDEQMSLGNEMDVVVSTGGRPLAYLNSALSHKTWDRVKWWGATDPDPSINDRVRTFIIYRTSVVGVAIIDPTSIDTPSPLIYMSPSYFSRSQLLSMMVSPLNWLHDDGTPMVRDQDIVNVILCTARDESTAAIIW